ncbi:MAG: hypothetical protein NT040_07340 [Bacteroidetes bacterium]|nr:hypothetical protein [Bacteroidota bacterium]
MKIAKLAVDSKILKRRLFEIIDFDNDWISFEKQEPELINSKDPHYIQIRIESKNLDIINYFEDHGFRFAEFKIYRRLSTNNDLISSAVLYPFSVRSVTEKKKLNDVLKIAATASFEDRFSMDHHFSEALSKERNLSFIKRSFNRDDEFLLEYFNQQNDRTVGFQTGKFISRSEVMLHLNGVSSDLDGMNYRELFDHLLYNWLKTNKIKFIYAVSSGLNMNEMNLAINRQGYTIESTSVILRKIYRND